MNIQQFSQFFKLAKDCFETNLGELSRLDSVLGDGDHGISMLKGFQCIETTFEGKEFASISDMLMLAGRTLMKEIGGSCGPLFATIFMQGATAVKGKDTMETAEFAAMTRKSADMIMNLGKSKAGEKTMLDALIPAAESLEKSLAEGIDTAEALKLAAQAAEDGAEATKDMLATKGRGRYQGEKSLGHKDAGAVSVSYIMRTFASV